MPDRGYGVSLPPCSLPLAFKAVEDGPLYITGPPSSLVLRRLQVPPHELPSTTGSFLRTLANGLLGVILGACTTLLGLAVGNLLDSYTMG